ncbi:MAG: FAS1-like dehydratase domain-containing protein [Rubrivivax sp.]
MSHLPPSFGDRPAEVPEGAGVEPLPPSPDALAESLTHWRTWIGKRRSVHDTVTAAPLRGLSATLDRDDPDPAPGDVAPPLAHWLYFLPQALQRDIGDDGHPRRGDFLPPVPLPRRMWAGGRFVFHRPLVVGQAATRHSTVTAVDAKMGRSGLLVFVTVQHDVEDAEGAVLTEWHDIVYREAPQPGAAATADQKVAVPADAAPVPSFRRTLAPDPVLLFRYSALTFNGHRIHYDRSHCRDVEGYPGLVVHGPLMATMLVDLLRRHRPEAVLERFAFKALHPVFDTAPLTLCGAEAGNDTWRLWVADDTGRTTMQAEAVTRVPSSGTP